MTISAMPMSAMTDDHVGDNHVSGDPPSSATTVPAAIDACPWRR
jgi:hypothetical protein